MANHGGAELLFVAPQPEARKADSRAPLQWELDWAGAPVPIGQAPSQISNRNRIDERGLTLAERNAPAWEVGRPNDTVLR